MKPVDGGVCAPKGFRASGVAAGIKKPGATKKDCALIVSDALASVAGVFTTNLVKAAPVSWTEGVCIRGEARAVFINSGNANAATGAQGLEDAQATAEQLSLGLDVPITSICIGSTGVIGVPLPMDRLAKGVDAAMGALSPTGGEDAAQAIMTTDTVPKSMALEVALSGGTVRIGAMAKGAGMIAPNMATMIAVLTTDAAISAENLKTLLKWATDRSFNCMCVDNDMSTNDTVVCLANGQSGVTELTPDTADYEVFAEAFLGLCTDLAQALVRDGEGATKFVTIEVEGAHSYADAKQVARSIAFSMLCKTAFHGEDPNWGRIACAAGYAGVMFNPQQLAVWLDDLQVLHEGLPTYYEEAEAAAIMKRPDFTVRVSIGEGGKHCTFWTSDLSYDYIRINAEYRT